MDDATETNLRFWEGMAAIHAKAGRGNYYDVEALVRGERPLGDWEERALGAVGDIAGLDLVHVQSHIGVDSIILAQRGAKVTAVDFSPTALAAGRDIARRAGVDVAFVEADANDLPRELDGRFDVAWVTIGAITWIEDLEAWTAGVARTLRPGGRLVMVEMHPIPSMINTLDPLDLDGNYAFAGPQPWDEDGSYADPDAKLPSTKSVGFAHSLGETVTAVLNAGLTVERLEEHLDTEFDPRGDVMTKDDDGRYRLKLSGKALPVLFTLIARKG